MVQAVVMPAPQQPLELRHFATPQPDDGGVVLRTLGSEVCGTDVHLWHGRLAGVPYPIIPGHVSVGEVVALGGEVRDIDGRRLKHGDIVTFLDVWGSCGRCWYCAVAHATTRCPQRKVYGITLSAEEGLFGGWSEMILLRPGAHIVTLPPELDWSTLLAAGCGLPTALHAVERGAIRFGDTVVIQGDGPVGLNAALLAQLRGAGQIILIGGAPVRLAMAQRLGVDQVIDINQQSEVERLETVYELTGGRGADVTIEATGVAAAVVEGMRLTRDAGRLVVVGQYTDAGTAVFHPHYDLNKKHLDVLGCWGSDASHLYRGVRVLARYQQSLPWAALISRRYTLHEAQRALEDVAAQRVVKALIVPVQSTPASAPAGDRHGERDAHG